MKGFLYQLFLFFSHLGGFGLLALGILDSSFLFMPLGNDLLIVAMTANNRVKAPYYALMAATGSVLGCALIDWVSRKGGEAGLEKTLPPRRLAYVKRKVKKSAGWALGIASLMPPPFPFTAFVAGASALQYPRKKLLAVIALTRFARFSLLGMLAAWFGKSILRIAQNNAVQYAIAALIVISMIGSALSIYGWIQRSRAAK